MKFDFFKSRRPNRRRIDRVPASLTSLANNDFERAQLACTLLLTMERNLKKLLQLKAEGLNHASFDEDITSIKVLSSLSYLEITGKRLLDNGFFPVWWNRVYGDENSDDHSSIKCR